MPRNQKDTTMIEDLFLLYMALRPHPAPHYPRGYLYYRGHARVGRDVTTTHQQGPVIVQSGTLTINSPKKVYIKNSFKVESGAKLRINP